MSCNYTKSLENKTTRNIVNASYLFTQFSTLAKTYTTTAREPSIYTSRQSKFITRKSNQKKVGLNALANRLSVLNNKIPLIMFNSSRDSFKIFSKKKFLVITGLNYGHCK